MSNICFIILLSMIQRLCKQRLSWLYVILDDYQDFLGWCWAVVLSADFLTARPLSKTHTLFTISSTHTSFFCKIKEHDFALTSKSMVLKCLKFTNKLRCLLIWKFSWNFFQRDPKFWTWEWLKNNHSFIKYDRFSFDIHKSYGFIRNSGGCIKLAL